MTRLPLLFASLRQSPTPVPCACAFTSSHALSTSASRGVQDRDAYSSKPRSRDASSRTGGSSYGQRGSSSRGRDSGRIQGHGDRDRRPSPSYGAGTRRQGQYPYDPTPPAAYDRPHPPQSIRASPTSPRPSPATSQRSAYDRPTTRSPRPFSGRPSRPRLDPDDPAAIDKRLPTSARLPDPDGPPPTLETLEPSLLSDLRLSLLRQLGRVPSQLQLETALPNFIKHQRTKEATELARAFGKLASVERRNQQLDVAWEWARKVEAERGLRGGEFDHEEDARVRERVEQRDREREEKIAKDKARDEQHLVRIRGEREEKIAKDKARDEQHLVRIRGERQGADGNADADAAARPLNPPPWLAHRLALKDKFPEGWKPPKRLSREAMTLLRLLQRSNPQLYTTSMLAEKFKTSPEAVRRILKSQFELSASEADKREQRRKEERMRQSEEDGGEKTWAGDWGREQREMAELRAGGDDAIVMVREAKSREEQPSGTRIVGKEETGAARNGTRQVGWGRREDDDERPRRGSDGLRR